MNRLTKVGLTALASAVIAAPAISADFGLSGGASVSYTNVSDTSNGNPFSFGDSITISASGELDNGMTVAVSYELDEGNAGWDDHKLSLSGDTFGTVQITKSLTAGGIGTIANKVPTANTPVFEVVNATDRGQADQQIGGDNAIGWTSNDLGGLTLSAMYLAVDTQADHSWSITYDASSLVDGLEVGYGAGEDGTTSDNTTYYAKYTMGGLTVAYQKTSVDFTTAGSTVGTSADEDATHYGISFAVNDDLSISAGSQTIDFDGVANDEENTGLSASYTMGSITLTAFANKVENEDGTAALNSEAKGVGASFAF